MRARHFLSGPVIFVATAFLFNAVVGVFGMNGVTTAWRLTLCGAGLFLALGAAWQTGEQKREFESERGRLDGFLSGGDSFSILSIPYAAVVPNHLIKTTIVRFGKFPLFDLRMRVTIFRDVVSTVLSARLGDFGSSITDIGIPTMDGPVMGPFKNDEYLRMFFNARNGGWVQDLILRKSTRSTGWLAATKVTRGLMDNQIVIFEDMAQGFEEEFGKPAWKA